MNFAAGHCAPTHLSSDIMLYHVTPSDNLDSILAKGLIPSIGPRSAELGELEPRIYLFRNLDDVETALTNWMADAFDENEELVVIEIDPGEHDSKHLIDFEDQFEIVSLAVIEPSRICRVLDESFDEIMNLRGSAAAPRM